MKFDNVVVILYYIGGSDRIDCVVWKFRWKGPGRLCGFWSHHRKNQQTWQSCWRWVWRLIDYREPFNSLQ